MTIRSFERQVRNVVVGGVLFLLFLAGLSLVVLRNTAAWGERESDERLEAQARLLGDRLPTLGDPAAALAGSARAADLLTAAHVRAAAVYDAQGNRLAEARFLPDAALSPVRLPPEQRPRGSARVTHDLPGARASVTLPLAGDSRLLYVLFDATAPVQARRNVRLLSALVPGAAVILSLLVIPFLRRVMRPIDALTETARDAGAFVPAASSSAGRGERDEAERAVATFARAVDELKRRSAELEELRRREKERADALAITAETLVRSHPGGLLVVDAEGVLADANAPALEALGLSRDTIGRSAQEALGDEAPLVGALLRARAGIPTLAEEFLLGEASGARRIAVTAVPVVDTGNRQLGTLLFLEDRTMTSRLERELSSRRELAALGEMSAGIAHEFRNATATILGYARLAGKAEDPAARARHLAAIQAEAEHVVRVTGDFLFFARPERLEVAHTPLGPLVAEIAAEQRSITPAVAIGTEGSFAAARVDAALLRRALVNLLRNACEAASAEGREGRVRILGEGVSDGKALLAVEDDGKGVPPEAERKLFVPFFSTKETGTGLGLAIVARIAALHGGSVWVERSASLGGARFVLALPAD